MTTEQKIVESEINRLKSGVDIISHAAKLSSYRGLLVLCYADFVNRKEIVRLQDLPAEQKAEIWNETKKESKGLNKKQCIELSKIVYMISQKM